MPCQCAFCANWSLALSSLSSRHHPTSLGALIRGVGPPAGKHHRACARRLQMPCPRSRAFPARSADRPACPKHGQIRQIARLRLVTLGRADGRSPGPSSGSGSARAISHLALRASAPGTLKPQATSESESRSLRLSGSESKPQAEKTAPPLSCELEEAPKANVGTRRRSRSVALAHVPQCRSDWHVGRP